MISNVSKTSREALASVCKEGKNTQGDDVLSVISNAHVAGRKDLSLREIKHLYQDRFSRDIDVSTVAARVNALVKTEHLVRAAVSRPCSLSGKSVMPVRVAPVQARLTA